MKNMIRTLIAEDERDLLLQAFNKSVYEIQHLHNLSTLDKMDVLGVLAKNMQEVTDRYPKLKEAMEEEACIA